MTDTRPEPSRWAVPLAAFGTICVLGAAGAILRPLGGATHVGGALVALLLATATAIASQHLGGRDESLVNRTIADVAGAGSVGYVFVAAGEMATATGVGSEVAVVVAGLVALPWAVVTQLRRPGPWALLAASLALVVVAVATVNLVDDAPSQAYAAALVAVALVLGLGVASQRLEPAIAATTLASLAALAAAVVLLGDDPGGLDIALAVLLLAIVTFCAAALRAPAVVAALSAAAPLVATLALWRSGHSWWSIPLAMAWSGALCSLLAAYVARFPSGVHVGGVFSWCAVLVVVAGFFLTNSTRLHALVELVCTSALFAAAVSTRRRAVAVVGALGLLSSLPRVVANETAGRFVVLALGVGLIYLATTSARRRPGRT